MAIAAVSSKKPIRPSLEIVQQRKNSAWPAQRCPQQKKV
jgi:hypothetical protein